MKRKLRLLFPLLLCSLSLSGCDFITIKDQDEEEVITIDKFYEGLDLEDTGGSLALNIQKFMFQKHTIWITYGQVDSYYYKTSDHNSIEAIADGSEKNQFFYTGKEASGKGTREHVWPCASSGGLWTHDKPSSFSPYYVDDSNYIGGGSDLFHIRTCNSSVNTARGNSTFVDFDDPEHIANKSDTIEYGEKNGKWNLLLYGAEQTASGGYQYANRVEPDDHMKGDIARIIMYVWVHYHYRGYYPEGSKKSGGNTFQYKNFIGSLPLTNIMGYDDLERAKEKLVEWNELDPPSEVEKLRNTTVQKIQGNRNIFVDYPNLVAQIFDL